MARIEKVGVTPFRCRKNVPLAPLTTLQIGGVADFLVTCTTPTELAEVASWCSANQQRLTILGGGSNVVVADVGIRGVVARLDAQGLEIESDGADAVRMRCGAGLEWDRVVATAVDSGFGGIECMSGIPGLVGAAPIQNIGAYGQELSTVVERVRVLELGSGELHWKQAEECGFAYRWSRFKGDWAGRFAVVGVELRLPVTDRGEVGYRDLQRRFSSDRPPSLADVRSTVLEVRASKSMVISATDPNSRSAGSFFVNPVVDAKTLAALRQQFEQRGLPAFEQRGGDYKVSAAWLIERVGFVKGYRAGAVGLSSQHALALINRGGATAAEVVAFAAQIRARVRDCTGITLSPEPVFLGFDQSVAELLD